MDESIPIAGTGRVQITKRGSIAIEIDCPRGDCDYKFDVGGFDYGLPLTCPKCNNITYNPVYRGYKLKTLIISGGITYILGISSGLTANAIWGYL